MLKDIIILLLIVNSLFWGLAPHSLHCKISKMIKVKCMPHWLHVYVIGLGSFVAALLLKQGVPNY